MKQISEKYMKQFKKSLVAVFDYLPTKYKANAMEWKVRKFVWAFKDGEYSEYTADLIAKRMVKEYDKTEEIVFACIPASSEEKNEIRYKRFSEKVCELTGAQNAYDAIKIEGEKLAIHESKSGKHLEKLGAVVLGGLFLAKTIIH